MPQLRIIGIEHLVQCLGAYLCSGWFIDDDALVSFFNKLTSHNLGDSSQDSVKWDLNPKGKFIVKSFYLQLLLVNHPYSPFGGGFPYRLIWKSLAH